MSLYRKLQRRPRLFLNITGMHLADFQRLMPEFEQAYTQNEAQRKAHVVQTGAKRQRAIGGGAHFQTDLRDRLLMVLLYYRLYLTQSFMTLLFNVEDKSTICRGIKQMHPVFEAVLPVPERVTRRVLDLAEKETRRRKGRINNVEDFLAEYPELSILIDGVEQPKQRPQDKKKRKSDYSGKKKRHTLKQVVMTTPNGLILHQSPACGGRMHDFKVFKEQMASVFEPWSQLRTTLYSDSEFTGIDKLNLPVQTRVVERARRNHPLTPEQKDRNRVRSRIRVKVEHAIGRRKKYKIMADLYRNSDADYEGISTVVAGLVNLRAYRRIEQTTGIGL